MTDNDYKQIDEYVNGQLAGKALADFEAQLLTNKTLAEEVALYKDVGETLTTNYAYEKEDAELKQLFNKLGKDYFPKEEAVEKTINVEQDNTNIVQLKPVIEKNDSNDSSGDGGSSGIRWLKPVIALAVAALIVLLIFQPWQRSLIDNYYEPYALNITQRTGSNMTALIQAQKAYHSGDYASALPVFEQYPDNAEVQLTKGNAAYNLGKIDEAIATFQQVASGDSVYVPAANWYLALAYLKKEQPEKAKAALDNIPEGSSYYAKAQELRNKI